MITEGLNKWTDILCFWREKLSIIKVVSTPTLIYKF